MHRRRPSAHTNARLVDQAADKSSENPSIIYIILPDADVDHNKKSKVEENTVVVVVLTANTCAQNTAESCPIIRHPCLDCISFEHLCSTQI